MDDNRFSMREDELFRYTEGAGHPTALLALSGGDGQFLDASGNVINHAGKISDCGHAGGKGMGMNNVGAAFGIALQQRFAPIAHVLPGAQQRECLSRFRVFLREVEFRSTCALRSHNIRTHAGIYLAFYHRQNITRIFTCMNHPPVPGFGFGNIFDQVRAGLRLGSNARGLLCDWKPRNTHAIQETSFFCSRASSEYKTTWLRPLCLAEYSAASANSIKSRLN